MGLLLITPLFGATQMVGAGPHPPAYGQDYIVAATDSETVMRSPDFTIAGSPFVTGGSYIVAESRPGAERGGIRCAAPVGRYYVYIAWARHREGAKDVVVRAGDAQVNVDQSRLANGRSPEQFPLNDMDGFDGICTSGLYRLSDHAIEFGAGDAVEIERSDTEPGTFTTLNYVVFTPLLYLDDLGNDAVITGRPLINLRNYGPAMSGHIGHGLAVLTKDAGGSAVEFTVPCDGLFVLAANPNGGPNRAQHIQIEVRLHDGSVSRLAAKGRADSYGRSEWQTLGVLRAVRGAALRIPSADSGYCTADLLRLTPISESDLAGPNEKRYDTFTLQWEEPSAAKPWLESVGVTADTDEDIVVERLAHSGGMPNGVQVRVGRRKIPVIGADDGSGIFDRPTGAFRVELAHDYGFKLTCDLLLSRPFIWLKQLGMFACANGDFASHRSDIRAMEAQVEKARKEPFVSTSEKYYEYTGFDETERNLDRRAFEFAYDPSRPLAPRVSESIKSMPEVGYEYFLARIQDPKHRKMFLGWPNVAQHFYVLSNGLIGTCSNACYGTGHPPAEDFTVSFGAGSPPLFKEHGDPSVTQSIDDGYHVVCTTRWKAGDVDITEMAFAYPLVGEEVRTGYEPLAAFVRLERTAGSNAPLWMQIKPDLYRDIYDNHLTGLGAARIENGMIAAGERIVLGCDHGTAAIVSASDDRGVLVRLEPNGDSMDFVIPYIQVDAALVDYGRVLGFDIARRKMKAYWDRRLARGAVMDVPDGVVTNLGKSLYERTMQIGELGADGVYALKISPIHYDAVQLHVTAYGIEGLARRGYFEEAKQYLDACFAWQGSQPCHDARDFSTWDGFFNAPPQYTPLLWLNFHGWAQWAAARYFLYSDDRAYLEEKIPALLRSLEWTASQRKITMKLNPDGSKPINYGWLPPARVTDGSAGTSTFSDCNDWMGFDELVRLLERIGHPRAAEFRAVADDYRACILRGLRLAARTRVPARLNDGTFVPYVPGYLESESNEEHMWYAAVVDAALEGIFDSGILPDGEPMRDWVLGNLEDNLFTMAPNLADEAAYLGHGLDYIRHDEPELAVYTFYSVHASHMSRQTLTTFEHRSWGSARVWDLAPWAFGYYTRMLSEMLCSSEGDEIIYGKATPKAWLDPGKKIHVERLQTRFGPTSLTLEGMADGVVGFIDVPTRYAPSSARLRLRVNGRITSVKLNGKPAAIDASSGTVLLPMDGGRVTVEAAVRR